MRYNPHCIEEQSEAQRGGEILPRSHSKSVGRNRLSPSSPAQSCGQLSAHSFSLEGRGFLGVEPRQTFMLLPLKQEDSDMPSNI